MNKAQEVARRLKRMIDEKNNAERKERNVLILPPSALTTFDDMGCDEFIYAMDGIYKSISMADIINSSAKFNKVYDLIEYEYYRI